MMRPLQFGLLAFVGIAAASTLRAQTAQPFSVQVSALYAGLSGEAYNNFHAGPGFEAQLRYTHPSGFSFGAGYQSTRHHVDGVSSDGTLVGPFFEPRYTFEIRGQDNLFPYASLRLSSLKQRIDNQGFRTTASGFTANAGGGLLIRLASRANLDVGATFGYTSFSDFVVISPSTGKQVLGGKTGSGTAFVLRTGLSLGII